jgi:hypothetical protein
LGLNVKTKPRVCPPVGDEAGPVALREKARFFCAGAPDLPSVAKISRV